MRASGSGRIPTMMLSAASGTKGAPDGGVFALMTQSEVKSRSTVLDHTRSILYRPWHKSAPGEGDRCVLFAPRPLLRFGNAEVFHPYSSREQRRRNCARTMKYHPSNVTIRSCAGIPRPCCPTLPENGSPETPSTCCKRTRLFVHHRSHTGASRQKLPFRGRNEIAAKNVCEIVVRRRKQRKKGETS